MRKIIVYIATSADGYIARPDGNVDWLNRPRMAGDYGMGRFYRSIDAILWGRKTYELALGFQEQGIKAAAFDPKVKNYVFSHHPLESPPPPVEFVTEPIPAFAKSLRARAGKDIWMMGGAGLIASFLDEAEIDEFIVHVIPTFIGEGIPLIAPRHRTVPLALHSCRRYSDGVVRLHYSVVKRRVLRRAGGLRVGRGQHGPELAPPRGRAGRGRTEDADHSMRATVKGPPRLADRWATNAGPGLARGRRAQGGPRSPAPATRIAAASGRPRHPGRILPRS